MKAQYKWALAAAAVLLVGFISLQQTGALWRSEANNGGGQVTAGILNISAGNEGVKQFTLDGLTLGDADPGDSVQKPLPVINSGNVTMAYKLNSVAINGEVPLRLRAAVVPSESACTQTGDVGTQVYSGPADTASTSPRNIAAGATEYLCLRLTVADNAETTDAPSVASFTFGAESVAQS